MTDLSLVAQWRAQAKELYEVVPRIAFSDEAAHKQGRALELNRRAAELEARLVEQRDRVAQTGAGVVGVRGSCSYVRPWL